MTLILRLIISIVICEGAGFIGAIFTMPKIATWYTTLRKPVFQPPNWLFGPAWTTLFLLMGIALFLVWNKGLPFASIRTAIIFFVVQFALNILWNVLFFGLQSPLAGLIEISVLWVSILLTIIYFWQISPPAGILLLPYIGWVSFATLLNAAIVYLNRPA
jgi:benzodiazapine receptor